IVYRMLPVQVIEHGGGAMLKRGSLELLIEGEHAMEVLSRILDGSHDGATRQQLRQQFAEVEHPVIDYVLNQLVERRLLVPIEEFPTNDETSEEIFYSEFGEKAGTVRGQLRQTRLVIIGVNEIARELDQILRRSGFEQVQVVDYPIFRNMDLFHPDGT